MPSSRDEDVRGLDVAVDDAARVRGLERVGNLQRGIEHLIHAERTGREVVVERFALQAFHDDERLALLLIDRVNRADVRVIERGRRARFATETFERGRVERPPLGEELESDEAAEAGVLGLVDDPHAAAAELLDNAVLRDRAADHVIVNEGG